jgi:IS30 family transposase
MTIDVETYLQHLDKGKSKLDTWEKEIFQLFHAQLSYQNIVDYLQQNNVHASTAEVYRYIHRKKRRHLLAINPAGGVQSDNPGVGRQAGKTEKDGAGRAEPANLRQEGSGLPKFSWRQSREKDKPEW